MLGDFGLAAHGTGFGFRLARHIHRTWE